MNIEDAIAAITRETLAERRPRGCSEEEIGVADTRFLTLFGHRLPIGYKRVLAQSNGLKYNGMTVWPILAQFGFSQTVFEANEDLRDTFDGRFLYFANGMRSCMFLIPRWANTARLNSLENLSGWSLRTMCGCSNFCWHG